MPITHIFARMQFADKTTLGQSDVLGLLYVSTESTLSISIQSTALCYLSPSAKEHTSIKTSSIGSVSRKRSIIGHRLTTTRHRLLPVLPRLSIPSELGTAAIPCRKVDDVRIESPDASNKKLIA